MRHVLSFGVVAVMCFVAAPTLPTMQAHAQMQAGAFTMQEKPLMVIRFNQRTVYYNKALYMAVSRAVETKPDVNFTLTSLVPQTGNEQRDKAFAQASQAHSRQVLRDMQAMGVPSSRIQQRSETSTAIDYDEVHLQAH